ncbi:MAG: hypothetical protein LBN00_06980 [Oscillospiraceae bacterium]|jgi:hypothetical protein|nr:hypothetical protein [Oscillospiraceae bacterium]
MMRVNKPRDDRGSGLVTVIVTVAFVAMLGIVLLFMSYMNAQIKSADLYTRRNFYSAEEALDFVRAELQSRVSDAIETAYTAALTSYENSERVFVDTFIDEISVHIAGYDYALLPSADNPKYIEIYGLAVENIIENSYQNTIYTDFEIQVPPYEAQSYGRYTRLSDYIIVADDLLTTTHNSVAVYGNVYAGQIDVTAAGQTLALDAGRVLSGGDCNIANGATLAIGGGAEIWVNRINVDGAHFAADAERGVHVADDLELRGTGASAVISGAYYGFGDSAENSKRSSSIIVNGSGAVLDLSGVTALSLAGRAFITNSNVANGTADIPMSGSVSARSDQTAYLVPDSLLTLTRGGVASPLPNPSVVGSENEGDISVNLGTLAARYGAGYAVRYRPINGATLRYFFLTFDTTAHRDAYFADFYAENNKAFQEYLNLTFASYNAGENVAADGFYYRFTDGGGYTLVPGGAVPASNYAEQYANLITTLRRQGDADAAADTTPFNHFVRADKIVEELRGVSEFTADGKIVALVVPDGDFTLTAANYPDVHVIIAAGSGANVTVTRPFEGLILSRGTVTLAADTLADGRGGATLAAFTSENAGGAQLLEYMRGSARGGEGPAGGKSWNLNELVTYRNWSKNEER